MITVSQIVSENDHDIRPQRSLIRLAPLRGRPEKDRAEHTRQRRPQPAENTAVRERHDCLRVFILASRPV